MFRLKTWVDKDGELTPKGRKLSRVLVCAYLLCLVLLCWTPQYGLVEGVDTPGIQHFGRVVVLLTPFNSLTNFQEPWKPMNWLEPSTMQNSMNS